MPFGSVPLESSWPNPRSVWLSSRSLTCSRFRSLFLLLSHLSPTLASIILFFSVVGFFFVQLVFVNFLVEHNLSVCRTNDLRCMLNEVWAQRAREGMVVRGEGVGIVLRMKSWAWRGGREAVPEAVWARFGGWRWLSRMQFKYLHLFWKWKFMARVMRSPVLPPILSPPFSPHC